MKKDNLLGMRLGSEVPRPEQPITKEDYERFAAPIAVEVEETPEILASKYRLLQMVVPKWRQDQITQDGVIALEGMLSGHGDDEIHTPDISTLTDIDSMLQLEGIVILGLDQIDPFNLENLKQQIEQGYGHMECLLVLPNFSRKELAPFKSWVQQTAS